MKFLTKKAEFDEVHIGDRVLLMADIFDMSAGSFGRVKSKSHVDEMIRIEWDDLAGLKPGLVRATDDFTLNDLNYLAFECERNV